MRGARGSFLPIADVELNQVTDVESDGYSKLRTFTKTMAADGPAAHRTSRFQIADNPNAERVAIEGYIAPFGKDNMVGSPTCSVRHPMFKSHCQATTQFQFSCA